MDLGKRQMDVPAGSMALLLHANRKLTHFSIRIGKDFRKKVPKSKYGEAPLAAVFKESSFRGQVKFRSSKLRLQKLSIELGHIEEAIHDYVANSFMFQKGFTI